MRILALASWFPYPPDNGARMRTHNLLCYLAQRHEIVLLSFVRDMPSAGHIDAVRSYCQEVRTVPFRYYRPNRLKALAGLFQSLPRDVFDTYSPEMETLVRKELAEGGFDVVLAFALGPSGGTAIYVQEIEGIPRVIEDLEISIIKDRIAIQPRWYQRARLRLTWWKLRNYIARLLNSVDGCTVVSEKERDNLLDILPDYEPLEVISNSVDLPLYDGDFGPTEPESLVFSGALTYKANFWAVEFFLVEVWPGVKAQCPGVKLYVTGRADGVPVNNLPLQDGVIFTGYLDDVRPRIACSSVCVVPMTVGGGTRLKILEAMALGTPVVSTSKGAEGLDVVHGQDIIIADDPGDFAQAVLSLLQDKDLRAKLAANGRRLVEERYSWEIGARQLEQLLYRVTGYETESNG